MQFIMNFKFIMGEIELLALKYILINKYCYLQKNVNLYI